ncbi:hypothetical protein LX32DRAFT_52373 [Colletotrichum zoysiae]|uniref:Uncharacterized protein n=1 Tax=Colletotrichum zoysiae TaxID=1216348 RepID=A0AAD9HB32_9PEZI|nr:hypothetical protein LX32DRAFT_52373 [Colletotrichum zoysiae]
MAEGTYLFCEGTIPSKTFHSKSTHHTYILEHWFLLSGLARRIFICLVTGWEYYLNSLGVGKPTPESKSSITQDQQRYIDRWGCFRISRRIVGVG